MTRILLLLLAGCPLAEPPLSALDCDEVRVGDVVGMATEGSGPHPGDDALRVSGWASHQRGLTIRTVEVAGLEADNEGFNFDAWSATVPPPVLLQLADGEDSLELEVVATDVCGVEHVVDEVEVVLTEPLLVERLELEVAPPGDEDWLPALSTVAAQVVVSANAEAASATVELDASLGDFAGGNTVTLAGDGLDDASATVLFSSGEAGTALLTASSGEEVATATVRIAGPPLLVPDLLALAPGALTSVQVLSDGRVDRCEATAASGILVTSGGVDISITPAAVDVDGDGRVDLQVEVEAGLAVAASVDVVCEDPYGQEGSAAISASP